MRVALLYPEVYDMARFKEHRKEFPPFGVLYLAAVIEQAGHNVAVKKVTPHATYLELSHYEAVGFSSAAAVPSPAASALLVKLEFSTEAGPALGASFCT
jgi:anaerobic magnesium-protoporphyrin IX monomethyl ester cyclase